MAVAGGSNLFLDVADFTGGCWPSLGLSAMAAAIQEEAMNHDEADTRSTPLYRLDHAGLWACVFNRFAASADGIGAIFVGDVAAMESFWSPASEGASPRSS
jgi:hypothetical protein